MALLNRRKIRGIVERWLPFASAVATFSALSVLKVQTVEFFVGNGLSLPQVYTAIFGWASVMTGFQFGVYGLIFSKTDGFISKILNTKAMSVFMSYTTKAVMLGFILTITGIPFLVSNIEMKDINNIMYFAGSLYCSLFVYSFAATVRVAALFAAMAKIPTRSRISA